MGLCHRTETRRAILQPYATLRPTGQSQQRTRPSCRVRQFAALRNARADHHRLCRRSTDDRWRRGRQSGLLTFLRVLSIRYIGGFKRAQAAPCFGVLQQTQFDQFPANLCRPLFGCLFHRSHIIRRVFDLEITPTLKGTSWLRPCRDEFWLIDEPAPLNFIFIDKWAYTDLNRGSQVRSFASG